MIFWFFLFFFQYFLQAQCSMCKAIVENNQANWYGFEQIGTGINTGIFFLILCVYAFWYFGFRKSAKELWKEWWKNKK